METLLITREDTRRLLPIGDCITAVEAAFRMHADGKAATPGILGIHAENGGFHIKAGILGLSRNYFVSKTNANFPENARLHGLPTIQGIVIVCDADNGQLLALMDSIEITIVRTGAATAVAAKYLARKDASTVTICGCGNQGRISLEALTHVRKITTAWAWDIEILRAQNFAQDMSRSLGISVTPTEDLQQATRQSSICVTCTTSRKPILHNGDVMPGAFIAAVGADNGDKHEIDPALIASSRVIADIAEQSSTIGDSYHALRLGLVSPSHIQAELGEIIAGKKPGRTSDDEVIVFDSTGTALQDIAAAAIVYERAFRDGHGMRFIF